MKIRRCRHEEEELKFTITASDPDGDALTYSATNLPEGANFDTNTQTFLWIPSTHQVGIYSAVTFTVSDPYGAQDSESITITVKETQQKEQIPLPQEGCGCHSNGDASSNPLAILLFLLIYLFVRLTNSLLLRS